MWFLKPWPADWALLARSFEHYLFNEPQEAIDNGTEQSVAGFSRIDQFEHRWCQQINHSAGVPLVRDYFRLISWLGNGWFWYALILSLPVSYGWWGWKLAALMTATGIACTLLYKVLKTFLVRERPFISFPVIQCVTPRWTATVFPRGTVCTRSASMRY